MAHNASSQRLNDGEAIAIEDPRPGTEQIVAGLWHELLGQGPIGRTQNFFDAGGTSLLAVRFIALAERAFGRQIPLASFFQAPTISDFAHSITRGSAPLIRKVKHGPPRAPQLFWVGAAEPWLIKLSRFLTSGVTLYSLEPSNYASPESSIESMAAELTSLILDSPRPGQYMLGARCLAGLLAYETAQQLLRAGEEISLLVLTEFYARGAPPANLMERILNRVQTELTHLSRVSKLNRRHQCLYYPRRVWSSITNLFRSRNKAQRLAPSLLQALMVACKRYRPAPFPGRVLFLESSESRRFRPSPSDSWKPLLQEIEIVSYLGAHNDIVDEAQIAVLAKEIDKTIDSLAALKRTARNI